MSNKLDPVEFLEKLKKGAAQFEAVLRYYANEVLEEPYKTKFEASADEVQKCIARLPDAADLDNTKANRSLVNALASSAALIEQLAIFASPKTTAQKRAAKITGLC